MQKYKKLCQYGNKKPIILATTDSRPAISNKKKAAVTATLFSKLYKNIMNQRLQMSP